MSDTYDSLKLRVSHLKREQEQASRAQRYTKDLESAALLQQRQQFEDAMHQQHDEIARLQAQLKQNTERSAKLRHHHDKEKKALQGQLDKLTKTLEGIDAEHAARAAEARMQHQAEAQAMRQQVEELQLRASELEAAMASEREAAERAQQAAVKDVEEWCQGEVDAVRHVSRQQLAQAHALAQQWQQQCEAEARRAADAAQANEELRAELATLRQAHEQLSAAASTTRHELEQALRRECEAESRYIEDQSAAAEAHRQEVAALKDGHSRQLDVIDQRLQHIIGKKDATIAALRAELQAVASKLEQLDM